MTTKESWRRQLRRIGLELGPPGDEGKIYATRFEAALESLKAKGKITDWRATEQFSEEDERGIDYFVEVGDQRIPFQITSTWKNAQKRRKRLREKGSSIPVLYLVEKGGVREGEVKPVDKVKGEIRRAIASYSNSTA